MSAHSRPGVGVQFWYFGVFGILADAEGSGAVLALAGRVELAHCVCAASRQQAVTKIIIRVGNIMKL